jgi:hypothetical protein
VRYLPTEWCRCVIRRSNSGTQKSFVLPAGIVAGNYDLLLNLPDKYPALKTKPAFSIRLANDNVWEDNTGYNKLNYTITIK